MRLIDADALIQALHKADTVMGQPHFLCKTVYGCINNAPTIDAVPVVRCKDCIGWIDHICSNTTDITNFDDFCSYGERKDDDTD